MSKRLALLALVAGCATPVAPAGVGGEPASTRAATPVGHDTSAPGSPLRKVLLSPTEASRSRGQIPRRTGSLLDVTCYAATGNRTASGKWPRVGMAAGPWRFGTRLRVEHVGVVVVEDRYGSGTQLDLFGPSESYCQRFGRQRLHVQVVR